MDRADLARACVRPETPIREAIARMDSGGVGIALVTDSERRLLGTLTDGDIRRAILAGHGLDTDVGTFLADKNNPVYPEPVWMDAGAGPERMLRVMQERRIRHLPLLDESRRVVDLALLEDLLPDQASEPLTAVVMAGGLGSRLRPLTADTPKPMLDVGGRPLLERTIERLRGAGVHDVVVSTRYKAEVVEEHFDDGSRFGVNVKYLTEGRPLGTAGSLRLMDRPPATMLVINGDVLTSVDFRAMRRFHADHGATLTVGVRKYEFSVPYGVVDCDGVHVSGLREKPTYTSFVNAGVYLLEPEAFDRLGEIDGEPFNMTDLIGRLVESGENVVSFPIHEYWMDIGQHEDYDKAQRDVAAGLAG
ncbi:MAG: nucleotidyltransferase family protein [Phycisphaerales bacterium]|nr:nucleotidyltransferase family protein [Phycisphaerales bacterium]